MSQLDSVRVWLGKHYKKVGPRARRGRGHATRARGWLLGSRASGRPSPARHEGQQRQAPGPPRPRRELSARAPQPQALGAPLRKSPGIRGSPCPRL